MLLYLFVTCDLTDILCNFTVAEAGGGREGIFSFIDPKQMNSVLVLVRLRYLFSKIVIAKLISWWPSISGINDANSYHNDASGRSPVNEPNNYYSIYFLLVNNETVVRSQEANDDQNFWPEWFYSLSTYHYPLSSLDFSPFFDFWYKISSDS